MKQNLLFLFSAFILLQSCSGSGNGTSGNGKPRQSLTDARKGFQTKITRQSTAKGDVEVPPEELFSIVQYPSAIGNMPAYLGKIPQDGKKYPAMIWLTGGFGNDIGDTWTPQEADNDQSAAAIREAGVVMMYPAQRGGNTSPGTDESFYGEIDDIIAAAQYLAKQPGVDPNRIYLGGHSTGGTKALLAAEYSNLFRATFAFGAAAAAADYGQENLTFDATNEKESDLRAPKLWLSSLTHPAFIVEGTTGNYEALKELEAVAKKENNKWLHAYALTGKDHFSGLQSTCRLIADKITQDTGADCNISINKAELMR